MELTNARWVLEGIYPLLKVEIDGEEATILYEQKALKYGLIFVGDEFAEILPPQTLPAEPKNGRPKPMQVGGFVNDPRIVELHRQFKAACDSEGPFKTGPVAIPEPPKPKARRRR